MRKEGVDHAVLECFVQYRSPLRFDEELDVHLVLAKVTRATFQIAYLVTVAGDARATAVTCARLRQRSRAPVRMPAWLASLAVSRVEPGWL
jgi:acyl-CoA thioesterase FadM